MSFHKRFIPLFAGLLLLLACGLPAAVTETVAPPAPTIAQANPTLTETVTTPATDTPVPAPPPIGAPITHLPAGQDIKITFIHMLDDTQGWALGGILNSGGSDHVLRTSDGGLTWKDITPPEPAPAEPQAVKKAIAFFMDAQKAWVAYSGPDMTAPGTVYIWYTTDSGATWNYSALTEPALYSEAYVPSDLSFIDAQHGWMMAHVGAGMNHDYYALLATRDGGATWQTLISPHEDSSGTQGCYKSGLVFATPQDGWMTVNCHGVVSASYFYKTHDGGATWESVNLPAPPAMPNLFDQNQGYCDMMPPIFFTTTSADLVMDCTQYTNDVFTKQSFLYETTDGGASWNIYPYPGGTLKSVGNSIFFALSRDIQRSDDAGHSWRHLVSTVNWDGQFSFTDPQTAWVVATNDDLIALVKSINGGLSWQEIKPKIAP